MSVDKKEGVYGENHPREEDKAAPEGIREKTAENKTEGVEADLEEVRDRAASKGQTGGMGRVETPKDGTTQGAWEHGAEEANPSPS